VQPRSQPQFLEGARNFCEGKGAAAYVTMYILRWQPLKRCLLDFFGGEAKHKFGEQPQAYEATCPERVTGEWIDTWTEKLPTVQHIQRLYASIASYGAKPSYHRVRHSVSRSPISAIRTPCIEKLQAMMQLTVICIFYYDEWIKEHLRLMTSRCITTTVL